MFEGLRGVHILCSATTNKLTRNKSLKSSFDEILISSAV